jgi:hypothetical protein
MSFLSISANSFNLVLISCVILVIITAQPLTQAQKQLPDSVVHNLSSIKGNCF